MIERDEGMEYANISVVVAIYNTDQYLDKCLGSIANQTLCPKEVLMINDGSTDRSVQIAQAYEERYEHFRLVTQENRGLSAARNTGIQMAKGQYLCFVDSDDYIERDYIRILYKHAQEMDCDIVFGDFYKVDEQDQLVKEKMPSCSFSEGKMERKDALSQLFQTGDNHYATAVVVMWNKLIRTEIMKQLTFMEGVLHEDEFMIMPLLLKCNIIVWIPKKIYAYRQRWDSITHDSSKMIARAKVLDAYEERIRLGIEHRLPFTWEMGTAYMQNITVVYYRLVDSGLPDIEKRLWKIRGRALKGILKYHRYTGKRQLLHMLLFVLWPDQYRRSYY